MQTSDNELQIHYNLKNLWEILDGTHKQSNLSANNRYWIVGIQESKRLASQDGAEYGHIVDLSTCSHLHQLLSSKAFKTVL